MRSMMMKDVQKVSLDVMAHFHKFCIENDLRYSLAFGTMIGAIRHKGFIPWDDDIDVFMPRPDFERLREIYKDTDDFAYFDFKRGGALQLIGRICDMKQTNASMAKPWIKQETGIWVDIFPLDACENDIKVVNRRCNALRKLWKKEWILRHAEGRFCDNHNFISRVKWIISCVYRLATHYTVEDLMKIRLSEAMRMNYGTSDYVANLCHYFYNIKSLWKKHSFEDLILVPFEDQEFYISIDYDYILRSIYGDYMKLPPESKRVHSHNNICFWKD